MRDDSLSIISQDCGQLYDLLYEIDHYESKGKEAGDGVGHW